MPGDYHISDIYQGGYSSLNPDYGSVFTGYHASASTIGLSTDPRTANIIKEVTDKIAPGQKIIELSLITPETIEAIPKQHLKEVNRIAKLTGVDITVHGPLTDASGVTQQGFDERNREVVENKLLHFMERSHELNPDGNIPVTFHTANQLPGARWEKISEEERKRRGIEKTEEQSFMPVVNVETGQITGVKKDEVVHPFVVEKGGKITEETYDVEKKLKIMNQTQWHDSIDSVEFQRESANRILQDTHNTFIGKYLEIVEKQIKGESIDPNSLDSETRNQIDKIGSAQAYLREAEKKAHSLFENAYKYGTEKEKEDLIKLAKEYSELLGVGTKQEFINRYNPRTQSQALTVLTQGLNRVQPKLFRSAEEYALEKSQETFGNTAFQAYKKFGDTTPIMNIENPPAGFGLSRAQDVRDMVEGSRKQFIKNAVAEGMSKNKAEKEAEKLIGVTWDVGHINQLRQFGFTSEDIIKEAEKIAPLLKHVHLSDNFGMENTELPMGMGNVDLKEVMKVLGEKGEKAKKIVEAAHWWQFQQTSPMGVSFEALGSPIYSMHMAPYWNQAVGLTQGYLGGLEGNWLPQINYETFGAGFSNLPGELGGQRPGGQGGRMSGRPME